MKKLLVGVSFAFFAFAFAQVNHSDMNMDGNMGNSSNKALVSLKGAAYDTAWLSQMIEHHRGAVQMSALCLKNCVDKDVRNAAQKIIFPPDHLFLKLSSCES